jgi:signal transduction histidine kinase
VLVLAFAAAPAALIALAARQRRAAGRIRAQLQWLLLGLVPATFGPLPAAVEVAAYRIAAEACTNVIRHAHATSCCIQAEVRDGWLTLTVADDGTGFGAEATAGVGLQSLHDRAAEVGGSLQIRSAPGGTTVSSRLPLQAG